jgi:hypothetical protein
MFFAMLEGYAVFSLAFFTYRIDLQRYLLPSFIIINLIDLQNYLIREEFRLNWAAPLSNLIIMILFITLYVRIPIIWSVIMSLTGYIALGVIQTAVYYLTFGTYPGSGINLFSWKVHEAQGLSGLIGVAIALLLYKLGYGFTFEFEKLRFRWEKLFITLLIFTFIISLIIMVSYRDYFVNLFVFGIALFLFLIYSLKKEAESE